MQEYKDESLLSSSPKPKHLFRRIGFWIFVLLATVLILRAVKERLSARREAIRTSQEASELTVHVIQPQIRNQQKELVLPGNVQAFADTPIYARTNGYVKRWLVDIGARVKEGQLLAEIESPEIDQQLNEALGSAQRAQADMNLALITTKRWQKLLARDTVSRQEADEKQGQFEAVRANLISAQANVERLQKLKGFELIYAPFNGVITVRNLNIGDLITANNTNQQEMFRIADDSKLRVYVNVPENAASFIKMGLPAKVTLASSPDIIANGAIVNIASAIDPQSRTMLTEVRVENPKHAFLSGGYATVSFEMKLAKPPLTLPVNTLLFRPEGTIVGVVGEDGCVSLRKVEIGKDFGNYVEIIDGLDTKDRVMLNPPDSLQEGDKVRIKANMK